MANIQEIAGYINDNFTGHTASAVQIARYAAAVIDDAGRAGGVDEITRIAEHGWPESRGVETNGLLGSEDEGALRGAIQHAARLAVSETESD